MNNDFLELGISPPILKAIEEMGFTTPTEVQKMAIPSLLEKKDLIVKSKTGSGKTAVFGVSMLQTLDPNEPGPQGLILTPTRELAVQVDNVLKQLAKHLEHRTTAVYGQHNIQTEIQAMNRGLSIITGTPGRVYDHIQHGNLNTKHIRFLVLDEADRMLDMGFIDQVVRIIKTLPRDRVTLLCSATIPDEIHRICRDYMKQPETIEIESQTKTVDTIEQTYYRVNHNEKRTQLHRFLLIEQPESCIIFCNTRIAVDQVQSFLSRKGYASQALHGDIPQGKRLKTIEQFKQGGFHLLVATDVAARGLHIDDLTLVINYDVPIEKDSYVHRIGRTGRAGNGGKAITLVTGDDLMTLYEIEEHIGALIEEKELPSESIYNEKKASAEKWIEANTLKSRVPQASVKQGNKNTRSQPSRQRSTTGNHTEKSTDAAQRRQSTEQRSNHASSGPQSSRGQRPPRQSNENRVSRAGSAQQTRQDNTANTGRAATVRTNGANTTTTRNNRQNGSANQSRRSYTPSQQRDSRGSSGYQHGNSYQTTAKASSQPTRTGFGTSQSQKTPKKQSFIERILQRLFGKKD